MAARGELDYYTAPMARRRVLYFIWSLERGGAERQLVELVRGLDPARYEGEVVVARGRGGFGALLPREPVSLDADGGFTWRSFARLVRHLRARRPDVVHTYMGSMNFFGRVAARLAGVPRVVGSVRCTELERADVVREALSQPLVDAVIVNSVGIRDELVRRAKLSTSRIDVIENGVDLERFKPLDDASRTAARAALGFEGFTIVVPGRVCAQKNTLNLVRALAALGRDVPEGVRFVIAGRDGEAEYAQEARRVAATTGADAWLSWRGEIDDLAPMLAAADGMLLASRYEGLPNVVLEAMASGVPAFVTPAANLDALVRDGVEGLVGEGSDATALAALLRRVVELTAERRAVMGRAGRVSAESRFSSPRMVTRTMAVYDRLFEAASAR